MHGSVAHQILDVICPNAGNFYADCRQALVPHVKQRRVEYLFASLLEKRRSLCFKLIKFIEQRGVIRAKLTNGAVNKASPFSGTVLDQG